METPVINMVEIVDFSSNDALLPIMECVSNSVISLSQTNLPVKARTIDVQIVRGERVGQQKLYGNVLPIKDVIVTDNGIGFNEKNFKSFQTPHSNILRDKYGCLGIGRFSVLAAFRKMKIYSNFPVNGHWEYREFEFDTKNEVKPVAHKQSEVKESKTIVELRGLHNKTLRDNTAVSVEEIAKEMMKHFLIFYLSDNLPEITIKEWDGTDQKSVNELYSAVAKENEASFKVSDQTFKIYRVRSPRTSNRKNNYVHYCADSRVVGRGKNLGKLDGIFNYPLSMKLNEAYLDVFVVSKFLDKKKTPTRNAFRIPQTKEESQPGEISFEEIELELIRKLRQEYSEFVKLTQQHNVIVWKKYISENPRYHSVLSDEETLNRLPAGMPDDRKEAYLHQIIHNRRKQVEGTIQQFIKTRQVTENSIQALAGEIHKKAVLDKDTLADYMVRRKAVIDLFGKFLEADRNGAYKLESDIHNLIFPMGGTSDDTDYGAHNLWLLDERLVSYKFIASDKEIRSYCDIDSRKAADISMFDNPIGYGDKTHGDISSLVIFEFKRPGEVAGNKPKNLKWEFSELTDKYFDDFRYAKRKKIQNKGRSVYVRETTPKFGYIILSEIPEALERYNIEHDWKRTPFGTFYKIRPGSNMHLEAMTFDTLIEAARARHNPFFDRLFGD